MKVSKKIGWKFMKSLRKNLRLTQISNNFCILRQRKQLEKISKNRKKRPRKEKNKDSK